MYVCTYVCMYVRKHARMDVLMYNYTHVCTYCTYVCMHVCMYTCMINKNITSASVRLIRSSNYLTSYVLYVTKSLKGQELAANG